MARKAWKFRLDEDFHTVELEHGYFSGKRAIWVDGELVERTQKFCDTGGEYPIQIAGHPGAVLIRYNGLAYTYDLVVDGRSLKTGHPVTLKSGAPTEPLPSWARAFVAACVLIPFVALGGALPGAIGAGGAAACAAIARNSSRETGVRVALCVGVTLLCWLLFLVLLVGLAAISERPQH